MITVKKAGDLCAAIYGTIAPGVFDKTFSAGQVTCGYAFIDGVATFTFAGSETSTDWVRDFTAIPYEHPYLGVLHLGFWEGMLDAWLETKDLLKGDIAIQGHSLGGAHAQIFAGQCGIAGIRIGKLTLFAPPRAGCQRLRGVVVSTCDEIIGFRNGFDPVPHVPIPIIGFPCTHVVELNKIFVPPGGSLTWDDIDPMDWHSLDLYRKGTDKY